MLRLISVLLFLMIMLGYSPAGAEVQERALSAFSRTQERLRELQSEYRALQETRWQSEARYRQTEAKLSRLRRCIRSSIHQPILSQSLSEIELVRVNAENARSQIEEMRRGYEELRISIEGSRPRVPSNFNSEKEYYEAIIIYTIDFEEKYISNFRRYVMGAMDAYIQHVEEWAETIDYVQAECEKPVPFAIIGVIIYRYFVDITANTAKKVDDILELVTLGRGILEQLRA